ncbi:hypothetical protein MPC4_850002 [Methylocella tundrae]|uniref:Uncharacterized protein n=1 Tax=Methylocella tundrae TaxID=227605 RepID=A0A8B6MBY4_METTU|nr:hypothetical protein MPC4_850002 [Methylocella tundrae]
MIQHFIPVFNEGISGYIPRGIKVLVEVV